jgi:4-hydroxy-2-oxoglutarate aldolase
VKSLPNRAVAMTRQEIIAHLEGIFPPVVTPFNRKGGLDEGLFRDNLQRYVGIGLGGVLVCGSTGEAPYLTERERLRLVEVARRVIRPPEVLMVGTGLESTAATLRLSREVIARGADALLIITPCYYKARMDADTLVAHYKAVASEVSKPVLVYSIPQFTGLRVDPATVGRLSRVPNVVGLKESSGDLSYVRAVLRRVRPGFRLLVGSVSILYDALRAGAVGAVLSQANFVPEICVSLYDAFLRRRSREARGLQQRLMPLAQKIAIPYGVAGIKVALDFCGYAGGPARRPLLPLSPQAKKEVAAALREARAGLEY